MDENCVKIPGSMMRTIMKTSMPDKLVQLPIVQFLSAGRWARSIFGAFVFALLSTSVLSAFCYGLLHPGFFQLHSRKGPLWLLLLLGGWLCVWILPNALDASIMSVVAMRKGKRALYLTQSEFWHLQLAESIPIQDIASIELKSIRNVMTLVTLKTKKPVQLNYWSPVNMQWNDRTKFRFSYNPMLLSGGEDKKTIVNALLVLTGNETDQYAYLK